MAILDDVKKSLGIIHNKLDDDIETAIKACQIDLQMAGVVDIDDTDPLTAQAIKLYCRSWYNYQGVSERYEQYYNSVKNAMAVCGLYNGGSSDAQQ